MRSYLASSLGIENDKYALKLTEIENKSFESSKCKNLAYLDSLKIPKVRRNISVSHRILPLGDSFAAGGYGNLSEKDVYPYLLEKYPRENSNKDVNVINLARGNMDMRLKVLTYKKEGMNVEPDLIILQYWSDDFIDLRETRQVINRSIRFYCKHRNYLPREVL